jgi:ABC-type enterochelin transport system substrate-binding protein
MNNLALTCQYGNADQLHVEVEGHEVNMTVICEENPDSVIILNKEKASQLRDWLNEFLGDSK